MVTSPAKTYRLLTSIGGGAIILPRAHDLASPRDRGERLRVMIFSISAASEMNRARDFPQYAHIAMRPTSESRE